MKNRILSAIAIVLLTTTSPNVHAQEKPDTRTQLLAISKQMQAEGDNSFLLVQALTDGLIENGQPYKLTVEKGEILINGKQPDADYQKQYNDMLNQYVAMHHTTGFSMTGERITVNEVLDPNSDFRKAHATGIAGEAAFQKQREADKRLIAALANDHLIDTTAGYSIAYKTTGLFINNKKLAGTQLDKYREMFAKEGYEPKLEGDGWFVTDGGKTAGGK